MVITIPARQLNICSAWNVYVSGLLDFAFCAPTYLWASVIGSTELSLHTTLESMGLTLHTRIGDKLERERDDDRRTAKH